MSSKKQKGIRMKRRTFVILILSVCVIAIGAEVALLVHSFTKRIKGAGKEPGKDPGEYVLGVSPAPSNPTPGGETEQPRKIYVKVKEEPVQSAERTPDGEFLPAEPYSTASYSHDEYGRLKRKEISFYGKDARDFSSTYIYEPSGTITETQSVYHETNDEPERKAFDKTYELPYGFTFSDSTGSNVTISYDEDGYWKKVVCGVPHEEAEFTYDEEGRLIKAFQIRFQGQSDDTAVIIEDEYTYLEDGTVILTRSSKDMETYSGRITNYDVMTYRDGRLMKKESYSDDVDSLHWIYEYKYTNAGRWESYSVIGDPHEDRGGTCFYLETGESFPPQIASWDASVYDDLRPIRTAMRRRFTGSREVKNIKSHTSNTMTTGDRFIFMKSRAGTSRIPAIGMMMRATSRRSSRRSLAIKAIRRKRSSRMTRFPCGTSSSKTF